MQIGRTRKKQAKKKRRKQKREEAERSGKGSVHGGDNKNEASGEIKEDADPITEKGADEGRKSSGKGEGNR